MLISYSTETCGTTMVTHGWISKDKKAMFAEPLFTAAGTHDLTAGTTGKKSTGTTGHLSL
jgi:hypothetical protein